MLCRNLRKEKKSFKKVAVSEQFPPNKSHFRSNEPNGSRRTLSYVRSLDCVGVFSVPRFSDVILIENTEDKSDAGAVASNEWPWLGETQEQRPEKCIICLQALILYQLMVMGTEQLHFIPNSFDKLGDGHVATRLKHSRTRHWIEVRFHFLYFKYRSLPSALLIQSVGNDAIPMRDERENFKRMKREKQRGLFLNFVLSYTL